MLLCFPVALGSIPPMCHRPGYSDERALGNPHLPFRKCGVFLGPDRRKHFNIYSCRVTRKLHRYYGTHDLGRCGSTFRSGRRRSSVLPSRVLQMLRAHSFAKYTNEWGTRLRLRTHREANPPSSEGRLLRCGENTATFGRLWPTSLIQTHRLPSTRSPE